MRGAAYDGTRVGRGYRRRRVVDVECDEDGIFAGCGAQDELSVVEVHDVGVRAHQPRLATPERDELAVDAQGLARGAIQGFEGWRMARELRAHRVVAAEALLFDAGAGVLVAGIYAGHAGDGEQHGERVRNEVGADGG